LIGPSGTAGEISSFIRIDVALLDRRNYFTGWLAALARPYWARALALTPPGLSYRSQIADQLQRLDGYLAMAERAQSQAAASAAATP